jgi:integrase/recombinase XerD
MSMNKPTREAESWERWLERFINRLEASGYASKTLRSHRDLLTKFIAYARESRVNGPEAMSANLLRSYLVYRREALNARGQKDALGTVNFHLQSLKKFVEFLAKEGLVPSILIGSIEYVKMPETLPKDIPTDNEVERMLQAVDISTATGFRDRVIMEVFYSTGMRRQELIDLKVGDVDLDQGFARIDLGKKSKGRIVPLGKSACEWTKRYLLAIRPELLHGEPDSGWLFLSKAGRKIDAESVRQVVVKARKLAKVEKNITPHALRRACATEMIRNNANPWYVKELLGHDDYRSMDVYTKLTILDLKEAHKRFHPRERDEQE